MVKKYKNDFKVMLVEHDLWLISTYLKMFKWLN